MRILQSGVLVFLACLGLLAQTTPDVGSGAPTEAIRESFVNAYFRNGFFNLVSLPPLADVKKLGTQGLVQEFADAAKNQNNKYALAKANVAAPIMQDVLDVLQFYPGLYSYYTSVGPNTAGYPLTDTSNCPTLLANASNTCQYQLFDKPYALFVYKAALASGSTNFATRNPFYTKWQGLGGISSLGPAASAEQAITSNAGTAATVQIFDQGAIFNITSGALNGRLVAVGPVVYPLYAANKSYAGFLGVPTADEITLASGRRRQTFEGGAIEYDPGGSPALKYPVHDIEISPAAKTIKLNLGDSMTLQATLFDPNGNPLTDRTVSWTTSNLRVVGIQSSGLTAAITAAGGGTALVTATSEGKISAPVTFLVTAPCCGIGEGAPSPAIQQAFVDAVNRNHLKLQLPAAAPVTRTGNGYTQSFLDSSSAEYLVTVSDRSVTGHVIFGALLGAYRGFGGPSGNLGYPSSDATAGGRQLFENQAALAGNPPQLVVGSFLVKWAALGYEPGPAGSPTTGVTPVLTFRATIGQMQTFAGGMLLSALTGPQTGKVYLVNGLALAAYIQTGGAAGQLGLPLNDEFTASGKRRQDFEGGFIDYTPGDAAAQVHQAPRTPLVTATPATVLAGGRVRLAVGGFDPSSTLKVSITSQPDFVVGTDNGAYTWESIVPASARSGVVSIHAVDAASAASADGSYTIRAGSDAVLEITKTAGDGQSGPPGSALLQPLAVLVRDDAGNPVAGAPVSFTASPGAQIVPAVAVTDANGQAQGSLRLPLNESIALATAQAGHQFVTFSAQARRAALAAFPSVSQVADVPLGNGSDTITQKGALLASVTAIVRYHQNRGELPNINGLADPLSLNQFLQNFCVFDTQGSQICDGFLTPPGSQEQFVNLWRVGAFIGNSLSVSVEQPDLNHVRDLLAQGYPVLLALSLNSSGVPVGGHYVVGMGVAADGGVTIMDPNPAFGRPNLNDYLSGLGGVSGTVVGAVRLVPRAPVTSGFLVAGGTVFDVISPAGACGTNLDLPAVAATAGAAPNPVLSAFRLRFCDGVQSQYEIDITTDSPFQLTLTDLGSPGNRVNLSGAGGVAFGVTRAGAQWSAAAQQLSFTSQGVVNAASFTPDIAPGGLFAVFGSGLAGSNARTSVEVDGLAASVLAQNPFQVNAQAPSSLVPGTYTLKVTSPYGTLEQPIVLREVAPAIFQVSPQIGAIINRNGALNSPDNPAKRGDVIEIFCTGLGATEAQGSFQVTVTPVTAVLNGTTLSTAFAGLAPGFIGLYQVNLPIPASTPPGLAVPLTLGQGTSTSNPVLVAVQ